MMFFFLIIGSLLYIFINKTSINIYCHKKGADYSPRSFLCIILIQYVNEHIIATKNVY
jgi:hypothetical protein